MGSLYFVSIPIGCEVRRYFFVLFPTMAFLQLYNMKHKQIIPECWEEMTPKQYMYLLRKIFVMMQNDSITKEDVLTDFADYLCGRNYSFRSSKRIDHLLLVNTASELLKWIFVESDDEVVFDYCTVQNLIPQFRKLTGPQSAGYDLRFGEYRKACWMYNAYTIDHDIASLDGLVGILYRPKARKTNSRKFNGDFREPFNEHLIGKYASRVKHWPEYIKWGIYLWFGYFCKHLMSEEFEIEGNTVSFAPLFQSGGDPNVKKDESLGMTSVLFSLAESRTFGNVDETDQAFLFNVMLKLLADHQTAQNLKKV